MKPLLIILTVLLTLILMIISAIDKYQINKQQSHQKTAKFTQQLIDNDAKKFTAKSVDDYAKELNNSNPEPVDISKIDTYRFNIIKTHLPPDVQILEVGTLLNFSINSKPHDIFMLKYQSRNYPEIAIFIFDGKKLISFDKKPAK